MIRFSVVPMGFSELARSGAELCLEKDKAVAE